MTLDTIMRLELDAMVQANGGTKIRASGMHGEVDERRNEYMREYMRKRRQAAHEAEPSLSRS